MKTFDFLYDNRPDKSDHSGWGYSGLLNLYALCDMIKPHLILISGPRTGQSAYLCKHFSDTVIFGDMSKLIIQDDTGIITTNHPIEEYYVLTEPKEKTLFIMDDDVPHVQRLEYLIRIGALYAVFNHNEPSGQVRRLKSPTSPTLEELKASRNPLFENIAVYVPLPFHSGTYNTKLTYIELA